MKLYWKYLILVFFLGILFSIYGTFSMYNSGIVPTLSGMVASMGFQDLGGCSMAGAMKYMVDLFPYFIFIIVFATYIYRHFCEGSVYVFSRCEKRGRWMCSEMIKLLLFSGAYVMVLFLGRLTPMIIHSGIEMDELGWQLFIYFYVIMTLWLFQITLLGNILAIIFNSNVGTTIVCITQVISVVALALIDDMNLVGLEVMKLRLNLNAHLVIEWHGVEGIASSYLNKLDVALNFNESVGYVLLVTIVWIIVGMIVIQKMDIIQGNKEV